MVNSELFETPSTVNISHISTEAVDEVISNIRDRTLEAGDAFGFRSVENSNKDLNAELITNTHTTVTRYDREADRTVEETVTSSNILGFRIDFENNILEVYGDKEDNGEVINRLGQTAPSLTTRDLNLDMSDIHRAISDIINQSEISAVRINNISPEPSTNGNCYLNTHTSEAADNLINKYKGDITYICTSIELDDDTVTIGFYKSGSVRVFSNTQNDDAVIDLIRQVVVEVKTRA